MTKERALEIKETMLSQMTYRISGRLAEEFYQVYNTEINPARYRVMPCTCDPSTWKQMINETKAFIDNVIEKKKK
jgi:hypothetical protein